MRERRRINTFLITASVVALFLLSFTALGVRNVAENAERSCPLSETNYAENNAETMIIVDSNGDGDYNTIQEAIDNAPAGSTIEIICGVYRENIIVHKPLILRGVISGICFPTIDGGYESDVIYISANNCKIENLTIINSGNEWSDAGIEIKSQGNQLRNNNLHNNTIGIFLMETSGNKIYGGNNIFNNDFGILQIGTDHTIISENNIYDNAIGIDLGSPGNNDITNNRVYSNSYAIRLYSSSYNDIVENLIIDNDNGIRLYDSSISNQIKNNWFDRNNLDAYFYDSIHNQWDKNHWTLWNTKLPKPIHGIRVLFRSGDRGIEIPWVVFDSNPQI